MTPHRCPSTLHRLALCTLLAAAAAGCSAGATPTHAPETAKPPVAVELTAAEPASLTREVEVVGTLAPRFAAEVRSELPGRLTAVHVTQWVRVAAGQPLAEVDSAELDAALDRARAGLAAAQAGIAAARAGVLEARVGAERAERELERLRRLEEAGLATRQGLEDGATARDAARARIAAAEAQVAAAEAQAGAAREEVRQLETRREKAVIRSPLTGVVAERSANVGDLPGDRVLFRVVDNALLDLTVTVPSRDLASVRVGQRLTFATDARPGETFAGTVLHLNPGADPGDRSVRVTAEVPNRDGRLRGGLFVTGRIRTASRPDVLQVPRSALFAWDAAAGTAEVFVMEGATARRRAVRTGAAQGDRVEVAEGLDAGTPVVTRGGFNLKDGDRVTVIPAGKGA